MSKDGTIDSADQNYYSSNSYHNATTMRHSSASILFFSFACVILIEGGSVNWIQPHFDPEEGSFETHTEINSNIIK